MNRLTLLSSALLITGGTQIAHAQPPGGGGFAQMDFDALNTETEDSPDYLTEAEVMAFMQRMMANRGGGPGGPGGPPGGGPGGPGGPRAGGPGGGPGGGAGPAGMFGRWDADGDGKVTREEFENRQRFGGPGGPGGPGGGRGPGAGQAQGQGQQDGAPQE